MSAYQSWSDQTLLTKAFQIVAYSGLPLEKWGRYFAGEAYKQDIPLREKAFVIWLYTLLDHLAKESSFEAMCNELGKRGKDVGELIALQRKMADHYRAILSLYSKEEQLFLAHIREQAVHGSISLWAAPSPTRTWYAPEAGGVQKASIPIDEFRAMINPLFSQMPHTVMNLLERLLKADAFQKYHDSRNQSLQTDSLIKLGKAIGVEIRNHR